MYPETRPSAWLPVAVVVLALLLVRDVLPPFVIGAVLAYLLFPLVRRLAAWTRLPHALCAILIFLPSLVLLGLVLSAIGSMAASELNRLIRDAPALIARTLDDIADASPQLLGQPLDVKGLKAAATAELTSHAAVGFEKALMVAETVASTVVDTLVAIVVGIYLTISGHKLLRSFVGLLPPAHRDTASIRLLACNDMLGSYLRGQLLLIAFMAALTWIGLHFYFHMPYAVVLALATGLLEIIPLAGPVMAIGLNVVVALGTSLGWTDVGVLVLFFVILRQLEDQLVIPLVVGETVGLHPAVGMLAVLGGAHLAGPLGMVLAIPVVAGARVLLIGPPEAEPERVRRWRWPWTRAAVSRRPSAVSR